MNINVKHESKTRAVVHLHADGAEYEKSCLDLAATYGKQANLRGYRPGKVPARVMFKRHESAIRQEAENDLVESAIMKAVDNEALDVLSVVEVSNRQVLPDGQGFSCDIVLSLRPNFELPSYTGLKVSVPRIEVTPELVDQDIESLRARMARYDTVERPAAIGDVAVVSYSTTLDGQPVSELHSDAPDYLSDLEDRWFLLAEEEDFLPGFYAALTGISAGESRTLGVDLDEEARFEPLRGKRVELELRCTEVKERRLPELNEEFFQQVGGEEMTAETLRQEVEEAIRRRQTEARDASMTNQLLQQLAQAVEFELPQDMVNTAAQQRTNEIAENALRQGASEEYLQSRQDEILDAATGHARTDVKLRFILAEIAKKERIEVPEQQLRMAMVRLVNSSGMEPKKFFQKYDQNRVAAKLRDDLTFENTLAYLKEHAIVEETDPGAAPQPEAE
jgi:trigger factor